jgi:hypothetical protein
VTAGKTVNLRAPDGRLLRFARGSFSHF